MQHFALTVGDMIIGDIEHHASLRLSMIFPENRLPRFLIML